MARADGPLRQLIDSAGYAGVGVRGRRLPPRWATQQPALGGFETIADVVRAGQSAPPGDATLIEALAGMATTDTRAAEVALAILAPRLRAVLARWQRAGVPAHDLDDLEAELVAEALTLLRTADGPHHPATLVDAAWYRVRLGRRRQRAHDARRAPLDDAAALSTDGERTPSEDAAHLILDAVRAGTLTPRAAQALWVTSVAGWPAAQVAAHLGCHPAALRARRSRAIRALAA